MSLMTHKPKPTSLSRRRMLTSMQSLQSLSQRTAVPEAAGPGEETIGHKTYQQAPSDRAFSAPRAARR